MSLESLLKKTMQARVAALEALNFKHTTEYLLTFASAQWAEKCLTIPFEENN